MSSKPRARILIRHVPHYRREAFVAGFEALGYRVDERMHGNIGRDDVLVIWNRYGPYHQQASLFERYKAAVIVAENGYLPHAGTKKAFALSLNHHNGAGRWPQDIDRRHALDVEMKPWRRDGEQVLLLPQRGIGPPGVAMPKEWERDVLHRLRRMKLEVRIRRHPGTNDVKPIERDLDGVRCAVTWGSGAALKAMIEGVPVFHEFPRWIGRLGASPGLDGIRGDPVARMGSRPAMLKQIAAAQWSVEEVITGEPFRRLLELHRTKHKEAA